ncbi:MAG: hypothetical protein RI893_458 [Pseudomonadota bacterium]
MRVNFNRSVKLLSLSIFLISSGCSTTAKNAFNDQPPANLELDNGYIHHAHHPFGKQKYNIPAKYNNTVWARLLSLYSLPDIENERIDRELNWYLRHPGYLARIQQRAEPYLHLILDEVEAKNIPGELALLPVVESAFLPEAYSKSDASGLWQFIPATGRFYGLKQNEWYDGRRDVYTSTKAATIFLKQLGETFDGDWHLALASYNFGKGNIRKAIEKNENLNLSTDYWSLDLPKETADYVPRLLAIAKIFANVEKYHVDLQHIPNQPYCELVDVKAQLDLNKAAELANTPLNEFLKLNPGFNYSSTAPQGPHHLLIPVAKAEAFKQNLAQLPYDEWVDLDRYHAETAATAAENRRDEVQSKIKAAENQAAIAGKNNTTKQSPNHLASNAIQSGKPLKILVSQKSTEAVSNKNKLGKSNAYVVKKGDTFWSIAQQFAVNDKELASWNNSTLKAGVILGQKLIIKTDKQTTVAAPVIASAIGSHPKTAKQTTVATPVIASAIGSHPKTAKQTTVATPVIASAIGSHPKTAKQTTVATPVIASAIGSHPKTDKQPTVTASHSINYTVKQGDSLTQISRKFNVSIADLRKWNPTEVSNSPVPGKKLKVILNT